MDDRVIITHLDDLLIFPLDNTMPCEKQIGLFKLQVLQYFQELAHTPEQLPTATATKNGTTTGTYELHRRILHRIPACCSVFLQCIEFSNMFIR